MKYNLFLDDERTPDMAFENMKFFLSPDKADLLYHVLEWVVVKNFQEFTQYITDNGLPVIVSFDNDLGEKLEGYDCAKWLCNYCMDNAKALPNFFVHTENGPGQDNIKKYLENFKKHQKTAHKQVHFHTWCSFEMKAGVSLAKILTDLGNDALTTKVSKQIHAFYDKIYALDSLKKHKKFYMHLLLKEAEKHILDANGHYPKVVETHLLNVINTIYKKKLHTETAQEKIREDFYKKKK